MGVANGSVLSGGNQKAILCKGRGMEGADISGNENLKELKVSCELKELNVLFLN